MSILGSCRQIETSITQNVFILLFLCESAWVHVFLVVELTHVGTHMYYKSRLCFCTQPMLLSFCAFPVLARPWTNIFLLSRDSGPHKKYFQTRFIFIDYADVMHFCESFEPG